MDTFIVIGTLALVVERIVEVWGNILATTILSNKDTDKWQGLAQRILTFAAGIGIGIFVAVTANVDMFMSLVGSDVDHGELLTGITIGLGTAPVHEVIKYVEAKKTKAKREAA